MKAVTVSAQTSLNPGELVIVTANTSDDKNFDFVPFVDLESQTVIHFTDNAYIEDEDRLRNNEGTITYTAPQDIEAGSVISYDGSSTNGFSEMGSFNPATSGDNILAYQGTAESPAYIYGVGWARGASVWEYDSDTSPNNRSDIPPGLSQEDYTILSLGTGKNYQYDASGVTEGTANQLLEIVGNESNWVRDDNDAFAVFSSDFSLLNLPTVAFAEEQITVKEDYGSVQIPVEIVETNNEEVSVDVSFLSSGSSAKNGEDFENFSTETITFNNSASSGDTEIITINLKDNNDFNGKRQAVFKLENISKGTLISPESLTLNIEDNDAPQVVINEFMADPGGEETNNDGEQSNQEDEFVEIVNNGDSDVDMSNWTLSDGSSVRYTFPSGTILPEDRAAVIFSGGKPDGGFGGAIIFTASGLVLNNAGDTITLEDDSGNLVNEVSYSSSTSGISSNRNPDGTGEDDDFVDHDEIVGSERNYSPGTKVNGEAFGGKYATGIRGEEGWRLMATPTQNTTFDNLFGNFWMQGVQESSDPSGPATLFYWSEEDETFKTPGTMNDDMDPGKGYLVYFFEDDAYNTPGNQGGFPKIVETDKDENNTPVVQQVSATDSNGNGEIDEDEGWNLLGNPFGTDISVASLLNALEKVDENVNRNISVWDHSEENFSGEYRLLGEGDVIAPFQAFFVRLGTPGINETLELKRDELAANQGAAFYKEQEDISNRFSMQLSTEGNYDTFYIEFGRNRDTGLDTYDAYKLFSLNPASIELFSVEGNNKLMKQALPNNLENRVEIPLSFEVAEQLDLTLTWDELSELPSDWSITLIDRKSDREIDMKRNNEYRFMGAPASPSSQEQEEGRLLKKQSDEINQPRFAVAVSPAGAKQEDSEDQPDGVKLNPNYPNPFSSSTTISYTTDRQAQVKVTVWNIVGQRVATLVDGSVEAGDHEELWNASDMPSGIYIAQLEVEGEVYIRKMTLIK